jgi:hypothetical protein
MHKYSATKTFLLWSLCLLAFPAIAVHQHHGADDTENNKPLPPLSIHNASVVSSVYAKDGRLWLAWVHGAYVYVNHSDDDGKSFSPPVKVNIEAEKIAAHGEARPKIAIGKHGNIYIAYTQKLPKRYTGNIRFSRSLDGGMHFSAPITVNSDRDIISHRFEVMTVNAQGDITLAWLDARDAAQAKRNNQDYTGSALYAAVSTDEGASFQTNSKIQDHSCQCCRIAMDTDSHGSSVVVWRQIFGENVRDHALVRLTKSETGNTLSATNLSRVAIDNWAVDACPHHGPALSIADDDIYHLTWFTGAPERQGLHYAHSMDQGISFNTEFRFGSGEQQAQHADVHSFGKAVFIVWKEFDGTRSTLKLMRSIDGGNNWSAASEIASATGPTDYPFFLVKRDALKVAWLGKENGMRFFDIPRAHHE